MSQPIDDDHAPHSALYFGETRDSWWHHDFLFLVARRLGLARAERVLDVGSGLGHWGRLVLPLCAPNAVLTGVDREPEWVRGARELAPDQARHTYVEGSVEALPFRDGSFDLVTCQTLLIHVRDPRAALREMLRVLRPGGVLLCAEPNNVATNLAGLVQRPDVDVEDLLACVRHQLVCERGKHALGEGWSSIGETLGGALAELGVREIHVAQTDRAAALVPPYVSAAEQAAIRERAELAEGDVLVWPRARALRYWIAGGGDEETFEREMEKIRRVVEARRRGLAAGTWCESGGVLLYLVSGRKGPP